MITGILNSYKGATAVTALEKDAFLIVGDSIARGTELAGGKGPTPAAGTVFEYTGTAVVEVGANDLSTSNTGSQWPQFGINYNAATGKKVLLVNTAVSGSEFSPNGDTSNWSTAGILYGQMQTKGAAGLAAFQVTIFRGLIILLAINDARGPQPLDTIQSNVNSFFSRARADFPGVPMYVVNIGRMETAISNTRIDAIRGYIQTAVNDTANCYMAFDLRTIAQDIPQYYGSDNLHLNQAGNNALGSALSAYIVSN